MISVFTVNGTQFGGVPDPRDPMQYPVQVATATLPSGEEKFANQLDGLETQYLINWVPVAYPAAVYPMGASVNKGVAQLVSLIMATPGRIFLIGYSQGAVVVSTVWRDYILNPSGLLNGRLNDVVGAINFGNPMRCPGVANGNTAAGWAIPSGGGISGTKDFTAAQTPAWWYDYANPNDLYTDSPVGTPAGSDEELIYNLIVTTSFGGTLQGLIRLIESAVIQFTNPLVEIIGMATAIFNGLRFLISGPNAGHYTYDIRPAISYLSAVAQRYA